MGINYKYIRAYKKVLDLSMIKKPMGIRTRIEIGRVFFSGYVAL